MKKIDFDSWTSENVSSTVLLVGLVFILVAALVSVFGGNGWFFSILVPGIGFALALGGLGYLAFIGEGPFDFPKHPLGTFLFIVAAVFLAVAIWRVIPSSTETPVGTAPTQSVNVVDGVQPVSRAMESDITTVQYALAAMPANQREAWLRIHYPHLAEGVQYYLQQERVLPPDVHIDRIRFMYGSLDGVRANSGLGDNAVGFFRNKIIALVYVDGEHSPRAFALQCMNGLMEVPPGYEARLQNLGTHTPNMVFTIGRREGLTKYLDYRASIDVAEHFRIPMYRGKIQSPRHHITYAAARSLQSETDRIQVTAHVRTGDRFDLVHMTCNGHIAHC